MKQINRNDLLVLPLMNEPRKVNSIVSRFLSKLMFGAPEWALTMANWSARRYLRTLGVRGPRIFSFTSPAELTQLMRLSMLLPHGGAILEIGSHLGASTQHLAVGVAKHGGRLYCVDTWQNQTMPDGEHDTYREFQQNVQPLKEWIVPIRKRSEHLIASDVPEPIHLAFIDGDHSYRAVRRDIELVLPLLADNAVIAFHDTTSFSGVGRCVGELLASAKWKIGGNVQSLTWLVAANWQIDPA